MFIIFLEFLYYAYNKYALSLYHMVIICLCSLFDW